MISLREPDPDFINKLSLFPIHAGSLQSVLEHATPLLQQRLRMLGGTDDWLPYLTWENNRGAKVAHILTTSHSTIASELYGYYARDAETYGAMTYLVCRDRYRDSSFSLIMRQELVVDPGSKLLEWKLQAIDTEHGLPDLSLMKTLEELQERAEAFVLRQQSATTTQDESLEQDDYWDQYDDLDDDNDEEEKLRSKAAVNQEGGTDKYYDRYDDELENVIEPDGNSATKKAKTTTQSVPAGQQNQILPDIVHHLETSLRSLRQLSRAANLTDAQFSLVYQKVMSEQDNESIH